MYYNAKNDKVFKAVVVKKKKILEKIIESTINREIEIISIKNGEIPIKNVNIKQHIVDVIAKTENEYIHIELNVHNKKYYKVRNLSYLFNSYSNNVEKGKSYTDSIKFIGIDLTFGMKKEKLITNYHLMSNEEEKYVENIEMIEVNMDKLIKIWYSQGEEKHKYLAMIGLNENDLRGDIVKEFEERFKYLAMIGLEREDLKDLAETDEIIKEFSEEIDNLNSDPVFVNSITAEKDEEYKRNSELIYAKKEGEEIGLAKGEEIGLAKGEEIGLAKGEEIGLAKGITEGEKQKSIEIAKKLLEENMNIEKIIAITSLDKEIIENLNKE